MNGPTPLNQLEDEERRARNRLAVYKAKMYSSRPASQRRMRELQNAWEAAAARLKAGRGRPKAP